MTFIIIQLPFRMPHQQKKQQQSPPPVVGGGTRRRGRAENKSEGVSSCAK